MLSQIWIRPRQRPNIGSLKTKAANRNLFRLAAFILGKCYKGATSPKSVEGAARVSTNGRLLRSPYLQKAYNCLQIKWVTSPKSLLAKSMQLSANQTGATSPKSVGLAARVSTKV